MLALDRLPPAASGFLLSAIWLAAVSLYRSASSSLPAQVSIAISALVLVLVVLASQALRLSGDTRRRAAVLGLFVLGASACLLRPEPIVVLVAVAAFVLLRGAIVGLSYRPPPARPRPRALALEQGRGVASGALLTVVVLAAAGLGDVPAKIALNGAIGWSALLLTRSIEPASRRGPGRFAHRLFLISAIASPIVWLPSLDPSGAALLPLLLLLVGNAALGSDLGVASEGPEAPADAVYDGDPGGTSVANEAGNHAIQWLTERPSRALTVTFALAGAVGGVLIALPVSAAGEGSPLSLIDALFTAFSAVCVTGLIVVDTPTDLSLPGQAIVLALIQIGGLGIMTFSTATLTLLGSRMSLRQEATAARLANVDDRRKIGQSVRTIILVTLVAESIGAVVLSVAFASLGDPWGVAAWRGTFTSISAFCNAGFALQSDSMIAYQEAPVVLMTCAVLIIVGGLGPILVWSTMRSSPRGPRLEPRHRLALGTTGALLVIAFVAMTVMEWNNTLDHLTLPNRITNGLFQAVTLRTAGFNSVDFALLRPATLIVALPMMFVGGCPGSTAGGIKTTTLALMYVNLRSTMRGDAVTVVANRAITQNSMRNASAVLLLGSALVFGVTLLLLLTQEIAFLPALFEAISALATVGLSVGATADLDEVGKIIVIIAMFVGRLGPLTLLLALGSGEQKGVPAGRYPEIDVEIA